MGPCVQVIRVAPDELMTILAVIHVLIFIKLVVLYLLALIIKRSD